MTRAIVYSQAGPGLFSSTLLTICLSLDVAAQTRVDLGSQSRGVDFQTQLFTKPLKTGVSLPGTCTQAELFFLTSAPPGSNIYACIATNSWAQQAGTGPNGSTVLYILDGGTADIYSGNATPSITSLTDGLILNVRVAHTNTSMTPTFNLNSLGANVIKHTDGTPLAVGELVTNGEALMVYYSGGNSWHLLNSSPQAIPPQSGGSRNQFLKSNGASLSFSMNPVSPGSGRKVAYAVPDGAVTAISTGKSYLGMWARSSGLTPAASEVWTPPTLANMGVLTLTSGAGTNNTAGIDQADSTFFNLRTGLNLTVDTLLSISRTTNLRFWHAFSAYPSSVSLATVDSPAAVTVGFRYSTVVSDPTFMCVISSGAATTALTSGVTADTNQHRFTIKMLDSGAGSPNVLFYIDGAQVCSTISATNYTGNTLGQLVSLIDTPVSGAAALSWAYWYTESDH